MLTSPLLLDAKTLEKLSDFPEAHHRWLLLLCAPVGVRLLEKLSRILPIARPGHGRGLPDRLLVVRFHSLFPCCFVQSCHQVVSWPALPLQTEKLCQILTLLMKTTGIIKTLMATASASTLYSPDDPFEWSV